MPLATDKYPKPQKGRKMWKLIVALGVQHFPKKQEQGKFSSSMMKSFIKLQARVKQT